MKTDTEEISKIINTFQKMTKTESPCKQKTKAIVFMLSVFTNMQLISHCIN